MAAHPIRPGLLARPFPIFSRRRAAMFHELTRFRREGRALVLLLHLGCNRDLRIDLFLADGDEPVLYVLLENMQTVEDLHVFPCHLGADAAGVTL